MPYHALIAIAALLAAAGAQARVLEAGPGRAYPTPSAAIAAAGPGDTVRIAPGRYVDCAVVTASGLTIEGDGRADQVVMTGRACEGKALLVIRGDDATVRDLTLSDVRIPDDNGAGIRGEGPNLTVERVRFVGNQNGILSGVQGGRIVVRDSDFEGNGFCGAACAHGVYAGHSDLLRIERSRFVGTLQGHHVKSRARRTEIVGCVIEDGPEGTASYEIEAPNGGSLLVRDSTIAKGPNAGNRTAAIVIGAEGVTQPTPEIVVENNAFRNESPYPTIFVLNRTATAARLSGNRLSGIGPIRALAGDGTVLAGP